MAARVISHRWKDSYSHLLPLLGWSSFKTRRAKLKIGLCCHIVGGHSIILPSFFTPHPSPKCEGMLWGVRCLMVVEWWFGVEWWQAGMSLHVYRSLCVTRLLIYNWTCSFCSVVPHEAVIYMYTCASPHDVYSQSFHFHWSGNVYKWACTMFNILICIVPLFSKCLHYSNDTHNISIHRSEFKAVPRWRGGREFTCHHYSLIPSPPWLTPVCQPNHQETSPRSKPT